MQFILVDNNQLKLRPKTTLAELENVAFTWEKVKTAEIAAKVTLAELENIDLTYGN